MGALYLEITVSVYVYMYVCRPICYRRKLLEENIKEVTNHIMLSEQTLIKVKRIF